MENIERTVGLDLAKNQIHVHCTRREPSSTVLTTNIGFEEWGSVLGENMMTSDAGPAATPVLCGEHPGIEPSLSRIPVEVHGSGEAAGR